MKNTSFQQSFNKLRKSFFGLSDLFREKTKIKTSAARCLRNSRPPP